MGGGATDDVSFFNWAPLATASNYAGTGEALRCPAHQPAPPHIEERAGAGRHTVADDAATADEQQVDDALSILPGKQ